MDDRCIVMPHSGLPYPDWKAGLTPQPTRHQAKSCKVAEQSGGRGKSGECEVHRRSTPGVSQNVAGPKDEESAGKEAPMSTASTRAPMAAEPVTPHAFVLFLWLRSPEPLTSQEAGPAVWGGAAPTQSLTAGSPGAAHEGRRPPGRAVLERAPRQAVAFSEPAWKVLLSAAAPSSPPGGESGRGGVAQGTSTSQWDAGQHRCFDLE